jgi:hypothetical protein
MLRIKLGDGRLRFDLERRIKRHRTGRRCKRHDVGDVGAPEDAVRHQVIGGFGGVVDADDSDQRARPLWRLQRGDHRIMLVLRNRGRGGDGRRRWQRNNPGSADGNQKCDNAKGAPQQTSQFHGLLTRCFFDRTRVYCRYVLGEMTQIPRKRSYGETARKVGRGAFASAHHLSTATLLAGTLRFAYLRSATGRRLICVAGERNLDAQLRQINMANHF